MFKNLGLHYLKHRLLIQIHTMIDTYRVRKSITLLDSMDCHVKSHRSRKDLRFVLILLWYILKREAERKSGKITLTEALAKAK